MKYLDDYIDIIHNWDGTNVSELKMENWKKKMEFYFSKILNGKKN